MLEILFFIALAIATYYAGRATARWLGFVPHNQYTDNEHDGSQGTH